ncbi:restriction endonuclease subunit S, partial [Methanocorpusculaceae archaeon]|nr:restriction endonuclease subunit S [Methanocorpusculaceae archaeon]
MTEYVRLGDVATINPPKKEVANLDDDTIVGFLPMDAVSNGGAIERIDTRKYAEVKKGFVYFRDGDVLFAKITPCMENGKGAVVSGMPDGIGFGSTEFHVVRPNEEIIYGQYIHYFLKNPALRKVLENEMTGSAGQKRVSKDTLKELA